MEPPRGVSRDRLMDVFGHVFHLRQVGPHARLRGGSDACVDVRELSGHVTVSPLDAPVRGRMVLTTCEPRVGQTPRTIETNTVEVR